MTSASGRTYPVRYFRPVVDTSGSVNVVLTDGLVDVDVVDGVLVGSVVRVTTRAVLVAVDDHGALIGRPIDRLTPRDGTLCFDPSTGGVRTRENRRARGAFNRLVAEANAFGMVNAYIHASAAARRCNALLTDVGASPLPQLHVVVGAHSGSRLPGYGCGDGDLRNGELRPMSGGHYRLSGLTTGVPEPVDVDPDGEVHLGPCRYRKPYAGWARYLRNAAHNPTIILHEFGHHLCRHTADFRLNGERRPARQRNGKTGVEEGVCDYFAAAALGSGRPYGWYNSIRGTMRDLEGERRSLDDVDRSDEHAVGAVWASAWWRARHEVLSSPDAHDRAVVEALVAVGEVAGGGKRRTRRQREGVRSSDATMRDRYLESVRAAGGSGAYDSAARILDDFGIVASEPIANAVGAC